jgi:hypothetical protein
MFQTKAVDKIKTHILCPITFIVLKNRAVYEIMWKNAATARRARDGNIIRRTRIEYCITKATDTHSEYPILIYCLSTATVFVHILGF